MEGSFDNPFTILRFLANEITPYLGKGNCLMQQRNQSQQIPQINLLILLEVKNEEKVTLLELENKCRQLQEVFLASHTTQICNNRGSGPSKNWSANLGFLEATKDIHAPQSCIL